MARCLEYQQQAVDELVSKTLKWLQTDGAHHKIVFKAPTGAGKTVMLCYTVAQLVQEKLQKHPCVFVWFAPRKLHLQSYDRLQALFRDETSLTPLTARDMDTRRSLVPGDVLFVNWESVNSVNNRFANDEDDTESIYTLVSQSGLPLVVIIDEEHLFGTATATKSQEVLQRLAPKVEIRVSATPRTTDFDEYVNVSREAVIRAQMIKKEIILNADISPDDQGTLSLNQYLMECALRKREQLQHAYETQGSPIHPLLLIQLPNDDKKMSKDDNAVYTEVLEYLSTKVITTENGSLAIWLSEKKVNLEGLEANDSLVEVLLFKEAIALGWDCPRAAVLLIFRPVNSYQFTVQTVGRIMRMPEQKHYTDAQLNIGYVYTNITREKIEVITADQNYLHKNTVTAYRRQGLQEVTLSSAYIENNPFNTLVLTPDFRKLFLTHLLHDCDTSNSHTLIPAEELWNIDKETFLFEHRPVINIDVTHLDIPVPSDVHLQPEVGTTLLGGTQMCLSKTLKDIDRTFSKYIASKGSLFDRRQSSTLMGYITDVVSELFSLNTTQAKIVILHPKNKYIFDRIIDTTLDEYRALRERQKYEVLPTVSDWTVPTQREYDLSTNDVISSRPLHALQPFVQLKNASQVERDFITFLENHNDSIDWWYKNGDKGKEHYAVPYINSQGKTALFYVDFVIHLTSGETYLFDTKTANSDPEAPAKHNALLQYISEHRGEHLHGGILLFQGMNWLYSPTPIENTFDTKKWQAFNP